LGVLECEHRVHRSRASGYLQVTDDCFRFVSISGLCAAYIAISFCSVSLHTFVPIYTVHYTLGFRARVPEFPLRNSTKIIMVFCTLPLGIVIDDAGNLSNLFPNY
jgi:hypothetical protein